MRWQRHARKSLPPASLLLFVAVLTRELRQLSLLRRLPLPNDKRAHKRRQHIRELTTERPKEGVEAQGNEERCSARAITMARPIS